MRVSSKEPRDIHRVEAVYLDNIKVSNCVEADDEEGYVIVHEFGSWKEHRKEGQVRIELRPEKD